MTSLFSFPLYPAPKAWDFCMSRVQCEGKKKVAWLVRLAGGWRAPALWFSCWSAATGEKEGCFLIPACTGLTCL